jgi:TatD DNase family protein
MNWVDAHCHLSDERLKAQLPSLLGECEKAGIHRFVMGGVDPREWERQAELERAYPGRCVRVFGLHPWWVHDHPQEIDAGLEALRQQASNCAAIGETGLDGARDRLKTSRSQQLHAFEAQIEIAREATKPLVLHIVRAHAPAIEVLERTRPAHGGIIHSFSGTWADARKYLDLGFTLSISARVTYPNAHDLHETAQKAPGDRLVFETDAPDQPPYGFPGKVHTPLSLLKVVQRISEIRQENPETLLDRSRDNLQRILRF